MIVNDCKTLSDQLDDAKAAKSRQSLCEQLEARRSDLNDLKSQVLTAASRYQALRKRAVAISEVDVTKALDRLVELRRILAEDPRRIDEGKTFAGTTAALKKLAELLTEKADEAWERFRSDAAPKIAKARLEQARLQPASRNTILELEMAQSDAARLTKAPPADEATFTALERIWEHIRELQEALPPETSDPEVQQFLREANSPRGAPLELLTEHVVKWLRDNGQTARYRVRSA
jgi:hypothetical protein